MFGMISISRPASTEVRRPLCGGIVHDITSVLDWFLT